METRALSLSLAGRVLRHFEERTPRVTQPMSLRRVLQALSGVHSSHIFFGRSEMLAVRNVVPLPWDADGRDALLRLSSRVSIPQRINDFISPFAPARSFLMR